MASEETVAGVVKIMRLGDNRLAMQQDVMREFADRVEAAYNREINELTFKLMTLTFKLMTAKSEQKTVANVVIEQTNKVEKLDSEVAELREFSDDMHTWFRLYYSCGSDPKSKWWRSCTSCRRKRCPIHKWRKVLKGTKDDSASR